MNPFLSRLRVKKLDFYVRGAYGRGTVLKGTGLISKIV